MAIEREKREVSWTVAWGRGEPAHLRKIMVPMSSPQQLHTKAEALDDHFRLRVMQVKAAEAKVEQARSELAKAHLQLGADRKSLNYWGYPQVAEGADDA